MGCPLDNLEIKTIGPLYVRTVMPQLLNVTYPIHRLDVLYLRWSPAERKKFISI